MRPAGFIDLCFKSFLQIYRRFKRQFKNFIVFFIPWENRIKRIQGLLASLPIMRSATLSIWSLKVGSHERTCRGEEFHALFTRRGMLRG